VELPIYTGWAKKRAHFTFFLNFSRYNHSLLSGHVAYHFEAHSELYPFKEKLGLSSQSTESSSHYEKNRNVPFFWPTLYIGDL